MAIYIPSGDDANPLLFDITIPDDVKTLDSTALLRSNRKNRLFLAFIYYLVSRLVVSKNDAMNDIKDGMYQITKKSKQQDNAYREALLHFASQIRKSVLFSDDLELEPLITRQSRMKDGKEVRSANYTINTEFEGRHTFKLSNKMDLMPFDGMTIDEILTKSESEIVGYLYETGAMSDEDRKALREKYSELEDEDYVIPLDEFQEGRRLLTFFDEGKIPLEQELLQDPKILEVVDSPHDENHKVIRFNTYEYYRRLLLKSQLVELKPLSPVKEGAYDMTQTDTGYISFKIQGASAEAKSLGKYRMGRKVMSDKEAEELGLDISHIDKKPKTTKKKDKRKNLGLKVVYDNGIIIEETDKKGQSIPGSIKEMVGTFKDLEANDVYSVTFLSRTTPEGQQGYREKNEQGETIRVFSKVVESGLFATPQVKEIEQDPRRKNYRKNLIKEINFYLDRVKKWRNSSKIKSEVIEDMTRVNNTAKVDLKGYKFDPQYFHYLTGFLKPEDKQLNLGVVTLELVFKEKQGKLDLTDARQIANKLETGSAVEEEVAARDIRAKESSDLAEDEKEYWEKQSEKNSQFVKEDLYADLKRNPIAGATQLIGQVSRAETIQWPELLFEYFLENADEYEFPDTVFDASFKDFNDIEDLTNELVEEKEAISGKQLEEEAEEMDEFIDESNLESGDLGEESAEERQERLEENRVELQTKDKTLSVDDALSAGQEDKKKKTFYEMTKYTKLIEKATERFRINHPPQETSQLPTSHMDVKRRLTFVETGDAFYQHLASVELAPPKKKRIKRARNVPEATHPTKDASQKKIASTLKMIKRMFNTMQNLIRSIK